MSGSSKKSLKAALALGGGLVTVGLMAAMLTDDDGPPEDVVDGVQSTMNGLVDKAGGAVAAMAASVGEAVKSSLGGVLKTSAPAPSKTKKAKKRKTKTKAAAKARKARKREAKAARATVPVTPPKKTPAAREEPVVPEAAPPVVDAPVPYAVGARVEARWAGTWYGAVVEELHADGSYEVEWTDTPNVFNTVAAADVRAAEDEPVPPPPPEAEEEAAPAAEPPAPAPPAAADDEAGEEEPEEEQEPEAADGEAPAAEEAPEAAAADDEVQGLLDGAAPRVVVDMLLANESFKIAFDQENPKRPDSASWTRYEAYKAATCGEQVLELGGSKSDVLHDYKKGFLRVTRCPAMIAYDLDRDAVAPEEPVTTGRPARRAPKRELFVAESATVDNKKLKGAE
ncbi:unnamed protein product [Pelagomonas calceolata]|uniref:Tudor domain-containing protein n=1 Tax=Pelagomonas calceolata TaxID=35677 RepID=A0A8J2SR91_9STRA|nr:unnamed protein product [Pelagomonas calceolata]